MPTTGQAWGSMSMPHGSIIKYRVIDAKSDSGGTPEVEIIIPVFESANLTICCLQHLATYTAIRWSPIVVDGGSSQESIDHVRGWLTRNLDRFLVLGTEGNPGFSFAVNLGIQASLASFIGIWNNDAFVGPECVDRIVAHLRREPDAACIGSVTDDGRYNDARRIAGVQFLDRDPIESIAQKCIVAGERLYLRRMCPFHSVVIPRRFMDEIGMMDEKAYPHGLAADDEWCWKARVKGYRIMAAGDAFCSHLGSQTFKRLHLPRSAWAHQALKTLKQRQREEAATRGGG